MTAQIMQQTVRGFSPTSMIKNLHAHPCKFQLHIRTHLLSAGQAGSVNEPGESRERLYIRAALTKAQQVERCREEMRRVGEQARTRTLRLPRGSAPCRARMIG